MSALVLQTWPLAWQAEDFDITIQVDVRMQQTPACNRKKEVAQCFYNSYLLIERL